MMNKTQSQMFSIRALFSVILGLSCVSISAADSIVLDQFLQFRSEFGQTSLFRSESASLQRPTTAFTLNRDGANNVVSIIAGSIPVGSKIGFDKFKMDAAMDGGGTASDQLLRSFPWESSGQTSIARSGSIFVTKFGTGFDQSGVISNNLKGAVTAVRSLDEGASLQTSLAPVSPGGAENLSRYQNEGILKQAWRFFNDNPLLSIVLLVAALFVVRVVLGD